MDTRRLSRRLLPPALADLAGRHAPARLSQWTYCPSGWPDSGATSGWDVASVAESQATGLREMERVAGGSAPLGGAPAGQPHDSFDISLHNTLVCFAYALERAAHDRSTLKVLDWGGGVGQYGVLARRLLPTVSLDYHVKELPSLCRRGRELSPDITFHEGDACLAELYDLIVASSSLQYERDWAALARRLAAAASGSLYVTRLPVVFAHPSFVVVQRPRAMGYDTEYPGWFLNRDDFVQAVQGAGMGLLREFLIDERPLVPRAPEQACYRGFLFEARGKGTQE